MKVFLSNKSYFYYSIAGKKHLDQGQKNEDYCLIKDFRGVTVFALADGVGSSKYPSKASKKAIKSICKTAKHFRKKEFTDNQFIEYFSKYFSRAPKRIKQGLSTTLIFVIVYKDNNIVLGQAGDGLLYTSFNGTGLPFKNKTDDFTNVTNALNAARKYKGWVFKQKVMEKSGKLNFFACSDGISEDLFSDNYGSFCDMLVDKVDNNKTNEIKDLISNWPVKGSIDDKSLFVGSLTFIEDFSDE